MKIGVLAIQGGYRKHQESLLKLKVNSVAVKYERQLNNCSALIIPGGESTTISKLLKKNSLEKPISEFALRRRSCSLEMRAKRPRTAAQVKLCALG